MGPYAQQDPPTFVRPFADCMPDRSNVRTSLRVTTTAHLHHDSFPRRIKVHDPDYPHHLSSPFALHRFCSLSICQFHDGLGFLTSHSLSTNTFEHSLQLVNPKLAVPYWDYTVETSSAYTAYDTEDPVTRSPIFSSEVFGGYDATDNMVNRERGGTGVACTCKLGCG